jgi:hypothetical protein
MAFANNDYVAVQDAKGKPAFELLTAPNLRWLMEEPPSMMWTSRYGMMRGFGRSWSGMGSMMGGSMMRRSLRGWYGGGQGRVSSVNQAVKLANRWLAQTRSGERVDPDVGGMGTFPGYYTLDTTRKGKTVGMLSVNARHRRRLVPRLARPLPGRGGVLEEATNSRNSGSDNLDPGALSRAACVPRVRADAPRPGRLSLITARPQPRSA